MRFWKMHGLGNDFVVIDHRHGGRLEPAQAKLLAERRYGIGCDQVLELIAGNGGADVKMLVHNADGSVAGTCGNGLRCVAWWLYLQEPGKISFEIETSDRVVPAMIEDGLVRLHMGKPRFGWRDMGMAYEIPEGFLDMQMKGLPLGTPVSVGNPHIVFEVPDVETFDVAGVGPEVEHAPLFPLRVNVEFITRMAPDLVRMRVWERGAGITPACGTGATAVAAVLQRQGLASWPLTVRLDGGDLVFTVEDGGLVMRGPAVLVFSGEAGV